MSKETKEPEHLPMTVTRVRRVGGSHIEPALDKKWSAVDRLRWQAGVVLVDTGLSISVRPAEGCFDEYCLGGSGWGMSSASFRDSWKFLVGFAVGAREAGEAKAEIWDKAVLHLEGFLSAETKRAAILDNPYRT